MRESTIIYRSFFEAIKDLPKENQAEIWNAIFEFSLNFNEVELTGLSKTIFCLIRPQLQANITKYKNGNNHKGKRKGSEGEAKGKRKVSEVQAKHKLNKSEVQANVNENVNENVNDNEKEKEELLLTPEIVNSQKKNNSKEKIGIIGYARCVAMWKQYHPEFNFSDISGNKLKSILKKINALLQYHGREVTEDSICDFFSAMIGNIPEWFKDKDLAVIDSKFNEIIEQIKNRNNGTSKAWARESVFRPTR